MLVKGHEREEEKSHMLAPQTRAVQTGGPKPEGSNWGPEEGETAHIGQNSRRGGESPHYRGISSGFEKNGLFFLTLERPV